MRISEWSSDVCSSDLCGYKFLNGGPGAPAYLFAAARHHAATPVLSGWFGHARPFAFEEDYDPAAGIEGFQCGKPPVLGLAALEVGVDLILEAYMAQVRRKWLALALRTEEHTSELQSTMRNAYYVYCLKKKQRTRR